MTENKKTWKILGVAVYAVFAVFYIWLAAQIPYTHDDWDWGLDIGMNQWLSASLNSRYVGNFFEVIMTRSELLKTIIMGSGFFLLPFLISRIAFNRRKDHTEHGHVIGFVLCNVLLLLMHRTIWQQTYGWIAGYANFGISSVFLAIILGRFLRVFDDLSSQKNVFRLRTVVLCLICLASQLFIENVSIYILLSCVFVNIVYRYRTKQFSREYLSMLLAALIGLVLMFSSNVYGSLWSTGEAVGGYRQVFVNSEMNIRTVITQFVYRSLAMPENLYGKNVAICIAIIVLMSVLLLKKETVSRLWKMTGCAINGLVAAWLLWSQFGQAMSISFFVVISVELFMLFKGEKTHLCKLFFLWISPIVIVLPLTFTSELGARLFFTTNAVLIVFVALLLRLILTNTRMRVCCSVITCALACALLVQYGVVYYAIGECKAQRDEIIEHAITTGADTIYLPQFPYREYLWEPNPHNNKREEYFKDFYNIPQDVTLVFADTQP